MWMRRIAAGMVIVLVPTISLAGQSDPVLSSRRIRVSGLRVYEIPGVLTLDGEQITASSLGTIEKTRIRVPSPAHGTLTVLRPGNRLIGSVLSVTPDTMSLA